MHLLNENLKTVRSKINATNVKITPVVIEKTAGKAI
jgi:hypothetical protein